LFKKSYTPLNPPLSGGKFLGSPPVFLSPFGGNTKGARELEGVKPFIIKILKIKINYDVYIK
jgi:hypothetical protein